MDEIPAFLTKCCGFGIICDILYKLFNSKRHKKFLMSFTIDEMENANDSYNFDYYGHSYLLFPAGDVL